MHQAPRHIAISLACCIKTENFDASMCHWNHNCNTRNYKARTLCWKDSTVEKSQGKLMICYSMGGNSEQEWLLGTTIYEASCVETKKALFWDDQCSYGLKVIQSNSLVWNLTIRYGVQNSGQCYTHIHRPEQDRWPLCHWSFPFCMELLSFQTTNSVTQSKQIQLTKYWMDALSRIFIITSKGIETCASEHHVCFMFQMLQTWWSNKWS